MYIVLLFIPDVPTTARHRRGTQTPGNPTMDTSGKGYVRTYDLSTSAATNQGGMTYQTENIPEETLASPTPIMSITPQYVFDGVSTFGENQNTHLQRQTETTPLSSKSFFPAEDNGRDVSTIGRNTTNPKHPGNEDPLLETLPNLITEGDFLQPHTDAENTQINPTPIQVKKMKILM